MSDTEKYKLDILAAATKIIQLNKVDPRGSQLINDEIAVEEPLEIQLAFGGGDSRQTQSIAVTMRTPGQDRELALGFLFTEGILANRNDVVNVRYVGQQFKESLQNRIVVELRPDAKVDETRLERNSYMTSSCGVCGKRSIEIISTHSCFFPILGQPKYKASSIYQWTTQIQQVQMAFRSTGGLHAAAMFDCNGNLLAIREDIGRHNAMDKLLGYFFLNQQIPLLDKAILLSGRASFELVQKASMVGIPLLVAVGAPSSLAVELAEEQGITLIGFLKKDKFNIYTNPERIIIE